MGVLDDLAAEHGGNQAPAQGGALDTLAQQYSGGDDEAAAVEPKRPGLLARAWANVKDVAAGTDENLKKLAFANPFLSEQSKARLLHDIEGIEAWREQNRNPEAQGVAETATDIVSGLVPYLATGPIGEVGIIGNAVTEGTDTGYKATGSLPRAVASGVAAGVTNAAMMKLPMGTAKQAAGSALAMPAIGGISDEVQNDILDNEQLHRDPLDAKARLTDLAMGLGFSGLTHFQNVRGSNRLVDSVARKVEAGHPVSDVEWKALRSIAKGGKGDKAQVRAQQVAQEFVSIPETGINDPAASVDDAIAAANAAVNSQPADLSSFTGGGSGEVSAQFLDPTMWGMVERKTGKPMNGDLLPDEAAALKGVSFEGLPEAAAPLSFEEWAQTPEGKQTRLSADNAHDNPTNADAAVSSAYNEYLRQAQTVDTSSLVPRDALEGVLAEEQAVQSDIASNNQALADEIARLRADKARKIGGEDLQSGPADTASSPAVEGTGTPAAQSLPASPGDFSTDLSTGVEKSEAPAAPAAVPETSISKGMQEFIRGKVKKLGSLEEVRKAYGDETAPADQFARRYAEELYPEEARTTAKIDTSPSFAELGRRSDEVQARIDAREDALEQQGVSWDEMKKDPELTALYEERIGHDTAAAVKGYEGARKIFDEELKGYPDKATYASVDAILRDQYALTPDPQTGAYMMSEHTGKALDSSKTVPEMAKKITQLLFAKEFPHADFWETMESPMSGLTKTGKERLIKEGIEKAEIIHQKIRDFFTGEHTATRKQEAIEAKPTIAAPKAAKPPKEIDRQKDDIAVAISKLGGIDFAGAQREWGDMVKDSRKALASHVLRQTRRFGNVFKSGGHDLDTMREMLEGHGYLPEGSSINDLYDAMERATRGDFAHSVEKGLESDIEREAREYEERMMDAMSDDVLDRINYDEFTEDERNAFHLLVEAEIDAVTAEVYSHEGVKDLAPEEVQKALDEAREQFWRELNENGIDDAGEAGREDARAEGSAEEAQPAVPGESAEGSAGGNEAGSAEGEGLPSLDDFERMLDEAAGKQEPAASPRYEKTAAGDQGVLLQGTRELGKGKNPKDKGQAGLEDMALFTEPRERAAENAQTSLPISPVKSMQEHISAAIDAGADALHEILKGMKDPNTLGSGPVFDDEAYQRAKPHLDRMWQEIKGAGFSAAEAAQSFAKQLVERFGAKIKPIAMKFYGELLNEERTAKEGANAERSGGDLERDSEDPKTRNILGQEDIQPRPAGTERESLQGMQDASQEAFESGRDPLLPRSETATPGESGDKPVRRSEGRPRPEAGPTGGDLDQRGGDARYQGPPVESVSTEAVAKAAERPVPQEVAGADDVARDLPQLLPGQLDDVRFAERRFEKPDGYGALFTNGTGTGKTYTGLGIIKRSVLRGKDNIIIVAPNEDIIKAWIRAGKNVGLDIRRLADTKDNGGTGPVITTYANFGQNPELVKRKWDLFVTDEAHNLSSNKDGNPSLASNMLNALSLHPDGAYQRATLLHPELQAKIEETTKALGEARKRGEDLTALQSRLTSLDQQWREARDAVQAEVDASQGEKRPRVVFLSATPFAYEKSVDYANGYLFDYGPKVDSGAYNSGDARQRFYMQHFGYRMRYDKLTEPDAKVDRGVMQRQFNSWLKRNGVLSGRTLDVDADYDRKFVLIDSAIGNKIDEGLEYLRENKHYGAIYGKIMENFDHLSRRYLLEAIKADNVVPLIKDHIALERKVVVFHDFNKGGGFNPFDVRPLLTSGESYTYTPEGGGKAVTVQLKDVARQFMAERPDLVNLPLDNLQAPLVALKEAFPDILVVNGLETKKDRDAAIQAFQDDADPRRVIMVQSDAGQAGISLHDTTGKHPRVLFNLGLPTKPVASIQQEGRIYRTGQVSDAMFRYLNTGTNWERYAFATTIANRTSAAENLALGESARALRDAFIEAFQGSDTYPAGHEGEGKGGKERDRLANAALSTWDRAVAAYFGQQKGRKNHLGTDYFATPEPLALKMVEWADIRPGDSVLEPSAGHGAIARWFPEDAKRRAIEPSLELSSRAALVFDGDMVNGTFENHNIVNKYDAIVMNPPFGSGGKTAVEHLAKAAQHLKEDGRIVAIIPTGPAADKRFEKWLYEERKEPVKPLGEIPGHGAVYAGDQVTYRLGSNEFRHRLVKVEESGANAGVIYVRVPEINGNRMVAMPGVRKVEPTGKRERSISNDLALRASYELPRVTFERAGTQVAARVVVLDKGAELATHTARREFSSTTKDINEFFDSIKESTVPERVRQEQPEEETPTPQGKTSGPQAATPRADVTLGEFTHTKTNKPLYVATVEKRLSDDEYKSASQLAKTLGGYYNGFNKGGAIRGFVFPDMEKRNEFAGRLGGLGSILGNERGSAPMLTDMLQPVADAIRNKLKPLSERFEALKQVTPLNNERGSVDLDPVRDYAQRTRDYVTISPVPRLARESAADAAVQHASARTALPHMVDDLLSKAFPDSYQDPEAMGRTIDILNKDNILGGLDEFVRRSDEARRRGDASEANRWAKAAIGVWEAHDIPAYDAEVRAAMNDPEISGNIDRWKEHVSPFLNQLYNEMKRVDPETEREGRGRHFDARINLLSNDRAAQWLESMGDETKPMPEPAVGNYRNPNVKKDRYDRAAYFTGDYSTDARAVLANVLGPRWNEVTKIRFMNDLVDKGLAVEVKPGQASPMDGYKVLPVKLPETNAEGATRMVEKQLFVRKDVVGEVRRVLNTDMQLEQNPVGRLLTQIQLAQIADAVTHTKNILSVVARAQGAGSAWKDVVRKMPVFGSAEALGRIIGVTREVMHDTPEIRAEIAEMAKKGLIRPTFPSTGLQKVTRGQELIHHADTAARITMNRFFDNLVERGLAKDSEANRRQFINQVGQYNKRLMGPLMQAASRSGLSPFVVAGRNFNRQGRWAITGNPGLEAASATAAVQMRVMNFMGTAALFTVPMMLNAVTVGNPMGRSGTPLGAWDLGGDDSDGKHKVIDLFQMTGLRRGMRGTGLEAAIEGIRTGKTTNQIAGDALGDFYRNSMHPWIGPAPAFVWKTLTGHQPDIRGKMEAQKIPEGGGMQYLENFRAALSSQNPLAYSVARPFFRGIGLDKTGDKPPVADFLETFLKSPSSALGVKDVYPDRSAAEQMAHDILQKDDGAITEEERAHRQTVNKLIGQLRNGDDSAQDNIKDALDSGDITLRDVHHIRTAARMEPLQAMFKRLNYEQAQAVYEAATEDEKEMLEVLMRKKRNQYLRDNPDKGED